MDAQELIRRMKEVKQQKKITYDEIMDQLAVNGVPGRSMSTLRRVFAAGSEERASSFNYEETLLPIRDAMKKLAGCPDDSHHEEEIRRLEERIVLLTEQLDKKDAMIMRLVDRLDQKDEIIGQLLKDIKQK